MRHPAISARRQNGFALVIVLGVLLLLVVLAIGFLGRVTLERSAASGYHASVTTRDLADTAVSLVQSQINIASNQGSGVSWVSQPGMVRTFDVSGTLLKAYKLYSGPDMIAGTVNITAGKSSDEPPADWATSPAAWVDLNAPVESAGVKNFPILDATAAADGFAVNSAPGATAYQPVPMPLRWLYVLRDGSLVCPTGSGNQVSIPSETAANPVVGRVAFWTDDESCKVNVNTAGEGTYWDVPRAETDQEKQLGTYQPAQREFQRYPGHPAMTSLSAVFSSTASPLTADQIYSLVPRVVGGGSLGGTALAANPLVPDNDRLYASIDELIFDPLRGANAGLTKAQLEQARFFLTAHSRAPETNLFNLPRIACWPIFKDLDAARTTAFDRLIAFCASTGEAGSLKPYYFQREKADSPVNDIAIVRNDRLYKYLQYLTEQAIPGFGGKFSTKYVDDRDQILTEIFDYIRSTNLHDDLLAANKQFTTYWPSTNVTNIPTGFGWVAPTVYRPGSVDTSGFGRTFTLSELGLGFICNAQADDPVTAVDESAGSNIVTGTNANRALNGTALNTDERVIQAILVPEFFCPMLGFVGLCPDVKVEISGLGNLQIISPISASLFPAGSGVATYDGITTNYDTTRMWGGNLSWHYSLYAKGSPGRDALVEDTLGTGLVEGKVNSLYPFIGVPVRVPNASGGITFREANLTVKIYAKTVSPDNLIQTIDIRFPATTIPAPKIVDVPVQKFGSTLTDRQNWWAYSVNGAVAGKPGRLYFNGKNAGGGGNPVPLANSSSPGSGAFFLKDYDVVRTVLPSHGDYRLIAASGNVSQSEFKAHPLYHLLGMFASSLTGAATGADPGFTGGKYIGGLAYSSKWVPDIPSNATGSDTPEGTGDYDNAVARAMDGPLVNKPDEGAINRIAGRIPYFDNSGAEYVGGQTFFSPNRQIPSPGMLGSLPTGVKANVPWRTLLFRPQSGHFGGTSPADHLMLDLFWMPVVEPYAISDRFSTSGKINLNYQILPFTYIERSTGMRALLKSEKVVAIPNSKANSYKGAAPTDLFRKDIDMAQTLSQFTAKFATGGIFRSASEICDLHIVPAGQTAAGMPVFWASNQLTGDNTRERIYTTLYPRLTARSNTYTVHFRVQALKKTPGSSAGTWTEGKDVVAGEYRGATTIERFINASNPDIPDYAADTSQIPNLSTLDKYYRWRVVQNRQFAP